jgi:hypothetical protein
MHHSAPPQPDVKPRRHRSNGELNKLSPEDRLAHDWYRFVLSFPPHLVRDYLEKFHITPRLVRTQKFSEKGKAPPTLIET